MIEDKYHKYRVKAEKQFQELYKDKEMGKGERERKITILEGFLLTSDLQEQGHSSEEVSNKLVELFRKRDMAPGGKYNDN